MGRLDGKCGVAAAAVDDLLNIGLAFVHEPGIHARGQGLAHQFRRPAGYDAHYLALAEREGCDFWTADERLWKAVRPQLTWVRWLGEYRPSPEQADR